MGEKRRLERDALGSQQNGHKQSHKRRKGSNEQHHQSVPSSGHLQTYGYDLPKVPPYMPPQHSSSTTFGDQYIALPPIHNDKLRKAIFMHPNTRTNKDAGARDDTMTYEPLEFLGDAYIEVIATRIIHTRFTGFNVGERSQAREMLVKNETLAEFSKMYGWDAAGMIKTSGRERLDGGARWTKILGDVFEAYVGAIIDNDKEGGFATAEHWLQGLWEPYLSTLEKKANANPRINVGELKDKLQNLLMNPKAGVKITYANAVPPCEDKGKGKTWYTREVVLDGWGHFNKSLGHGESANSKTADGLAIQDAFAKNMDLIMEANTKKKDYERKAKELREATEAISSAGS